MSFQENSTKNRAAVDDLLPSYITERLLIESKHTKSLHLSESVKFVVALLLI